jgi:hypothetical protein
MSVRSGVIPAERDRHNFPGVRARLAVAVGIGLILFAICVPPAGERTVLYGNDFLQLWRGARSWIIDDRSPYEVQAAVGRVALYYPAPALVAVLPAAWLPFWAARAMLAALTGGLLAYALTARAWWPLYLLASGSFFEALAVAQISPLLLLGVLIPPLGVLYVIKPSIGLMLWSFRPTLVALVGGLAVVLITVIVYPAWPWEWLAAIHGAMLLRAPVTQPFGWLLLLALFRWRRPDARLLAAMACVPHTISLHEAFPLGLALRSRHQMLVFACGTWVIYGMQLAAGPAPLSRLLERAWPGQLALYLAVLAMTLARPNRLEWPEWMPVRSGRITCCRREVGFSTSGREVGDCHND